MIESITITNQATLLFFNKLIQPNQKNDIFSHYYFKITKEIFVNFESKEFFDNHYYLTTFPIRWDESKGIYIVGSTNQTHLIHIEIIKRLFFLVNFPFQVHWNSNSHVNGIVIKSFIANLPESISNKQIKPQGKIKEKNNLTKDSLPIIIQLTNLQPRGSYTGSISYNYTPKSWLLSTKWGSKNDYDRKMIQKYTGEQKYWRFPQEFEKLIQPLSSVSDVYNAALQVYEIAIKTITVELLDYRKGVLNLLHDMRGDCDEFTDLMIVLLRRLSFPVRRVTGMTYNFIDGKIVHHAWPEIFSPSYQMWIPIDAAMKWFGFQSLSVIPLKIEGTKIIPNTLEVNIINAQEKVDLDLQLLDTDIRLSQLD